MSYPARAEGLGKYDRSNKKSKKQMFSPRNYQSNQMIRCFPQIHLQHTRNKRMCEIDIGNLKTRNFTKLVQVRNFLSPLSKRLFDMRETQSFYADCFYIVSSQPNRRAVSLAHKVVWPHPALKVNFLLPRRELN